MKRRTALKVVALGALTPKVDLLAAVQSPPSAQTTAKPKGAAGDPGVLASIRLYNPTSWTYPSFVEVPVGEVGGPGLIEWGKVRLVREGQEVAFSIREGRAHWKASLGPVAEPRAEDLVVFATSVPQGAWAQLDLVRGERQEKTAISREGTQLTVSYPNLKVAIDETTGMLVQVEAFGEGLLEKPLSVSFFQVGEGVLENVQVSYGYVRKTVTLKKGGSVAWPRAKLVSSFSDAAMSELNFVFEPEEGPATCLTYRVHGGGLVEILADERPWEGASPWMSYGIEYKLSLNGEEQRLPQLETRIPYRALHDYVNVVQNIGVLHRGKGVGTLEVGEEFINGRRWHRWLYLLEQAQLAQMQGLVQLVEEGLAVDVVPESHPLEGKSVEVSYADGCQAIAETLVQALRKGGLQAASSTGAGDPQSEAIVLKLVEGWEAAGLEGDGYAIRPLESGNGASIISGAKFGLMTGTLKIAAHLRRSEGRASIPLIASNPGVDLRGAVFGGWPWQADFPHGDNDEWIKVLNNLITSGMNTITCTGLWSTWRMPVTYKYMPELRSDSPEAYDEISGSKLSEVAADRERGLALANYLRGRGVRVWLFVGVGAIPTTFAEKFPEAVLPGEKLFRGRPIKPPRVMHPKYREYLRAYFKEVLETYPVEGIVMCRDDNGGTDDSEEFKQYLATSRTKDPVWEQYLMIHEMLRTSGFRGDIAVTPYGDIYKPSYESALPNDLFVLYIGSCYGLLARSFKVLAPSYDTWLQNLYVGSGVATSSEMKRYLSDRGSYWGGGAYRGTELPWEAIGYFGWHPAKTVNTFRYDRGSRAFSEKDGLSFRDFNSAYERLWNLMKGPLMPYTWLTMSPAQKKQVEQEVSEGLTLYQKRFAELHASAGNEDNKDWFAQVKLYAAYVEYCLRRLEMFSQLYEIGLAYKDTLAAAKPLPDDIRRRIASLNGEMLKALKPYQEEMKTVPGRMMRETLPFTGPYKEWAAAGFGQDLDAMLTVKKFAGTMTVVQDKFRAGRGFTLTVELYNGGFCPWLAGDGPKLELDPAAKGLGLPLTWGLTGEPVLPGDRRVIKLPGTAPSESGTAKVRMRFMSPAPFLAYAFIEKEVLLKWD